MADWKMTLRLGDVYHAGRSIPELAGIVASRLKVKAIPGADEYLTKWRDEIVDAFEDLAADEDASHDDFNYVMRDLYDWADTPMDSAPMFQRKKLCWVDTLNRVG